MDVNGVRKCFRQYEQEGGSVEAKQSVASGIVAVSDCRTGGDSTD